MTQLKSTLWSSFAATLLITTWSATFVPSWADSQVSDSAESATQAVGSEERSEAQLSEVTESPSASTQTSEASIQSSPSSPEVDEAQSGRQPVEAESEGEVVKVGEYQSQEQAEPTEDAIANILPHTMDGRSAATLYVRNIPVLTFLGSASAPSSSAPQASQVSITNANTSTSASAIQGEDVKVASVQMPELASSAPTTEQQAVDESDPVLRATAIAATLNQLHRQEFDAETVTVKWDDEQQAYVIYVGEEVLVQIDDQTILPDTTRNPAEDALQSTNRIRRLLGSAPPLDAVEGAPSDSQTGLVSTLQSMLAGMASWYGPGFDGNYSASGEIFNQNAMTAAHPSLPFGTQVRVTNLDNGLSVIVRINDRGPHAAGRVIDLSTAAAGVIGLINSGVAPVSLEVVDASQASTGGR